MALGNAAWCREARLKYSARLIRSERPTVRARILVARRAHHDQVAKRVAAGPNATVGLPIKW